MGGRRWRAQVGRLVAGAGAALVLPHGSAFGLDLDWAAQLDPRTAFGSAILLGLVFFATTLAILYLRERTRWTENERALTAQIARLRGADDRAELLLGSERQVIIVWAGSLDDPMIEGDPTVVGSEGASFRRVLAFGSWLTAPDAGRIETALSGLRERGQAFRLTLRSTAGAFVEAEGRTVGGRALLRLRDVSEERSALLASREDYARVSGELGATRALLDALDEPIWLRDAHGRLAWVNRAYKEAVEARDEADSPELLDVADRETVARRRTEGAPFRARLAAVVAGSRRMLDIVEVPLRPGRGAPPASGGMARDASEAEDLRAELARQAHAHERMLDQLPTAVAMFDGSQRLAFHNAGYRRLWGLDPAFLDGRPTESEILDRLRADRKLPEQADYRGWKAAQLESYRSPEPIESWWHLPDRRTLRVVANPGVQGGITYLFEDVSDRLDLESRVNALTRVQGETLDALAEGVALFGQNGRLKLHNRAFATMWRLPTDLLLAAPHIDELAEAGRRLAPADASWAELKAAVSGLSDMRERAETRMERSDGSVVDCAAEPLPDGSTLLTFADVTATVNVERALTERNEALEQAGRLRDEFVHHVSYELRSPLTNIIGFAELLGAETVGPLNERQREYAGHITRSSGSLLAIINDILDLASIDTDTIELSREPVNVAEAIEAAALGIRDRLAEAELTLAVDAPAEGGEFLGDPKRVRQIIYNLLSNAAAFSLSGQTIRITARREDGYVALSVADQGRGIAPSIRERVFGRFESHSAGSSHRGAGLGLSIVRSFVELHGGRVDLASELGVGTVVTCYFPAAGPAARGVEPAGLLDRSA